MKTLDQLNDRREELRTAVASIVELSDTEKRDLTEDESAQITSLDAEFRNIQSNIDARVALDSMSAQEGRKTSGGQPTQSPETRSAPNRVTGGDYRNDDQRRNGWNNFGEFSLAVRSAATPGRTTDIDQRLLTRASTTFGSEGTGADGGFAVPPAFREEILSRVNDESSLLSLCDKFSSSTNSLTFPKDETPSWNATGGVQAYWEGEHDTITQSKPLLKQSTVRLNKLAVLVPITEELMEDAPAVSRYLSNKAPQAMDFKISDAILNGTGAGMPLGIINSSALISVAKVGSQVADTVVGQNFIDMYSRMPASAQRNGVWLYNQDIQPQIISLFKVGKLDTGAVDTGWGSLLNADLGAAPNSTILGRPAIATQACQTVGDKGDVFFVDLSQYMAIEKVGGIRAETSVHLWFDSDEVAFRFIYRLGGQPWWNSTIAAKNGSTTYSPYVTLDARA